MVKFYTNSSQHEYPFPTVTLAYFLRYPNPFAQHVLSTDVIERYFDPETQRLYTARLHLKRSKIPSGIVRLLPKSILGASATADGRSQSLILERSMVDVKEGVMLTESRNLELTGVLAVVERQLYRRPHVDLERFFRSYRPRQGYGMGLTAFGADTALLHSTSQASQSSASSSSSILSQLTNKPNANMEDDSATHVNTKVELISQLGSATNRFKKRAFSPLPPLSTSSTSEDTLPIPPSLSASSSASADSLPQESIPHETTQDSAAHEEEPKMGFWRTWTTGSVQRTIELIGLRRTERAIPNSKKGMNVVLDRLRRGGLVAVLEGMKNDGDVRVHGD